MLPNPACLPGSTYESPLTSVGLPDIRNDRALSALYFYPKQLTPHRSVLLPGVRRPSRILSSEDLELSRAGGSRGGRGRGRGRGGGTTASRRPRTNKVASVSPIKAKTPNTNAARRVRTAGGASTSGGRSLVEAKIQDDNALFSTSPHAVVPPCRVLINRSWSNEQMQ